MGLINFGAWLIYRNVSAPHTHAFGSKRGVGVPGGLLRRRRPPQRVAATTARPVPRRRHAARRRLERDATRIACGYRNSLMSVGGGTDSSDAQVAALHRDGFVLIRECVPAEQLPGLRDATAALAASAALSMTGSSQPRLSIDFRRVYPLDQDAAGGATTASASAFVGFCLSDAVLGRTRRLLGCSAAERVAVHQLQAFPNPENDEADATIPPPGQEWGTDPRNWVSILLTVS